MKIEIHGLFAGNNICRDTSDIFHSRRQINCAHLTIFHHNLTINNAGFYVRAACRIDKPSSAWPATKARPLSAAAVGKRLGFNHAFAAERRAAEGKLLQHLVGGAEMAFGRFEQEGRSVLFN